MTGEERKERWLRKMRDEYDRSAREWEMVGAAISFLEYVPTPEARRCRVTLGKSLAKLMDRQDDIAVKLGLPTRDGYVTRQDRLAQRLALCLPGRDIP